MSPFGEPWLSDRPFRIGLVGCGRISDIYLKTCARFPELDVIACASLDLEESERKAAQFGIARACRPEDIFSDPSIDCVLNLTVPAAHAEISMRALDAGKHIYSEKPFVTNREDAPRILKLAAEKELLVGNAPDTFLGGRWQTVRRLIDEGAIGKPTGVFAHAGTHGTERHHPNPDYYYAEGGGPLLDLGPYYLTAMVFCLGPIARVAGLSRRTFESRMIENGPRYGHMMPVEVDTHILSLLEFESGVIGDMTMSFDIWDSETPRFEIYGETGTISVPDPDPVHGANVFQGEVWLRTRETARWTHQPRPKGRDSWQIADNLHGFNEDMRGLGLLDLAYAAQHKRPPRASGTLARHVFDVMNAIETASATGHYQRIPSRCRRPDPMPVAGQFPDGHSQKERVHAD